MVVVNDEGPRLVAGGLAVDSVLLDVRRYVVKVCSMRALEASTSPIRTPAYVDNNTSGLCPRRRATSPIGTPAASHVVAAA